MLNELLQHTCSRPGLAQLLPAELGAQLIFGTRDTTEWQNLPLRQHVQISRLRTSWKPGAAALRDATELQMLQMEGKMQIANLT